MNNYIAFYNGKRTEVVAMTLYEAQNKALAVFKPPKSKIHMVHTHLAEIAGQQCRQDHSLNSVES